MSPHSGVIVFDLYDRPFPVIGWATDVVGEREAFLGKDLDGSTVLYPVILDKGSVRIIKESAVKFMVVGNVSDYWRDVLVANNPTFLTRPAPLAGP